MQNETIDFLIITALPVERDAIRNLFNFKQIQSNAFFYEFAPNVTKKNINLALTMLSKVGNVDAGIHVTQAIQELNPKCVLMVGIAGGIKEKVKIGDVLIGTDIFYYEQAKTLDVGKELRPQSIPTDSLLQNVAENINKDLWMNEITDLILGNEKFSTSPPSIHFGPIASGEKVVADQNLVPELLEYQPKLLGVEMESYGVARAAAKSLSRPRFITIRGISDYANSEKNDDYHVYAATMAATFAKVLILSSINNSLQTESATALLLKHMSMEFVSSDMALGLTKGYPKIVNFVIDQTDLFDNGRMTDPLTAIKRQQERVNELKLLFQGLEDVEITYYGIAHIPLVFQLGFQFRPRKPVRFVEYYRSDNRWDYLETEDIVEEPVVRGLPYKMMRKLRK